MGALVTPWLSLVVYGCLFCFADGRCITLDGWSAWYLLRGDVVLINCHSKESWDSCWIHHPSSWRKDSSRVRVSIAQLLQFISDGVGRVQWCWCCHGNCRRRAEDVGVILKVFMMLFLNFLNHSVFSIRCIFPCRGKACYMHVFSIVLYTDVVVVDYVLLLLLLLLLLVMVVKSHN